MSRGGWRRVGGLAADDGETEGRRDGGMGRAADGVVRGDSGNLKLKMRGGGGGHLNEIDFGSSGLAGAVQVVEAATGIVISASGLPSVIATGIESSP